VIYQHRLQLEICLPISLRKSLHGIYATQKSLTYPAIMLSLTPAVAAVARVVHLSSDAIVDYPSPFSLYWKSLPKDSLKSTAVTNLPHGSDPTPELLRQSAAALLSCTAPNSSALIRLLPHLPELSVRPVVIHVVVQGDLADASVLRAAVPYFIHWIPSVQSSASTRQCIVGITAGAHQTQGSCPRFSPRHQT